METRPLESGNGTGNGGSWDQWAVFVKETLRRLDLSLKEISEAINEMARNFSIQELQIKETKEKVASLENKIENIEESIFTRDSEDRKNRTLIIVAIIAAAANILIALL